MIDLCWLKGCLAWGVTQGHSVLPKSKTPSRIKSNLEGDFRLSEKDIEKIRTINKKTRFNDTSGEFGRDFFQGCEDKTKWGVSLCFERMSTILWKVPLLQFW